MTPEWVRRQILAGRLRARVFKTGGRVTYRIRDIDLRRFLERWSRLTDDPNWEDFADGEASGRKPDAEEPSRRLAWHSATRSRFEAVLARTITAACRDFAPRPQLLATSSRAPSARGCWQRDSTRA